MAPLCFLDTKVTDLIQPEVLSPGLVNIHSHEHYSELDITTDTGNVAEQKARATHSTQYHQVAQHALQLGQDEAWLRTRLKQPAFGLGGRRPADVLDEAGGLDTLKDLLVRLTNDVNA